jgi:biofilm PGA synthesis lipoprotein PgaB
MPMLEGIAARDSAAWLQKLQAVVAARPNGMSRTLFELQAVDWNAAAEAPARHVPAAILANQMRLLLRGGAQNIGYYPDDIALNRPDVDALRTTISTHTYPYSP